MFPLQSVGIMNPNSTPPFVVTTPPNQISFSPSDILQPTSSGIGHIVPNQVMNSVIPSENYQAPVSIKLENENVWQEFGELGTEMVVTKIGRRMFPTLRFNVSGLDPNASYCFALELTPADFFRYRFHSGHWAVSGHVDHMSVMSSSRDRIYVHPDSPAPGRIWTKSTVSFHKLKLTNNPSNPDGNVLVSSLHKYIPRLMIFRIHGPTLHAAPSGPLLVASQSFPSANFIAVTAYQNEKIIKLKIERNPFAKGFRAHGKHTLKRSSPAELGDSDESSSVKKLERVSPSPHCSPDGLITVDVLAETASPSNCSSPSEEGLQSAKQSPNASPLVVPPFYSPLFSSPPNQLTLARSLALSQSIWPAMQQAYAGQGMFPFYNMAPSTLYPAFTFNPFSFAK